MLVLHRKPDETIVIETPAGDVAIMLTETGYGWAKIGVAAPKDWTIRRGELIERDREEAEKRAA